MTLKRLLPIVFGILLTIGSLAASPSAAATRGALSNAPTPPRLRFIDGPVSFWRTGAADWSTAQVNTPLAAGDALYAGDGGNLEIQIGPQAFIRAGAGTELDLTSLSANYMQYRMTGGHAALDLQNMLPGQTIEIDTPNAAISIDRPGYYRIDVAENNTAFSVRRGGAATVVPATGATTAVADNQQIILDGTDQVRITENAAPPADAWDQWNDQRTAQFGAAPRSAQYVPPQIAGAQDLDAYGDWSQQPQYGNVWVPRGVGPDWAPYSTGRWVYDPSYQWTWVDDAPWGWAPYHYGRWVSFNGGWGWCPGPVVAAPVYSPALVAFFGAPGVGVLVSVGLPFVSWVALGFGEPIVPWWGGSGFIGHPYWGGWGGPHVVNNVVVNNTRIVNINNVNNYSNARVRNAVVGVDRNQFGRGQMRPVALDAQRMQQLRPLHGNLGVRPVAASLTPGTGRGQRPPERLQARQVVATRSPQDTVSRLHARGIQPAASVQHPAPRIVQARPAHAATAGGQPAVGGVPHTTGQQPPPVPGRQPPGGTAAGRSNVPGHPQAGPAHAVPPPPPGGTARQPLHAVPQPPAHQQAAPQQRSVPPPPPQGRPAPHAVPQAPTHERAAPQQHNVPAQPQGRPGPHTVPQSPAHQAAPQQRSVAPPPPQNRSVPHAVPQSSAHQQAAPQQQPQARPAEHARPQAPAQSQAPPAERSMSRQPSQPQRAPQPHAQPQPRPQHAAPQPHAAPQQPHGNAAPKGGHNQSKPEH